MDKNQKLANLAQAMEQSGERKPIDDGQLSAEDQKELAKAKRALAYLADIRGVIAAPPTRTTASANYQPEALIQTGAAAVGDTVREFFEGKSDEFRLPEKLGRFDIIRTLGQGGFGKVMLGRDPVLSRLVAIKVPNPSALLSEEARKRFEVEARAAAVLTHPAIVPVFESSGHGPIRFLVTAYCPGPTLAEWFDNRDHRIAQRTAAQIVFRLAEGMHHAHQRGVIHRDLKPANVLVDSGLENADGNEPPLQNEYPAIDEEDIASRVRITDFGLARELFGADQLLTTDGAIVGTPAYMSPEQAAGEKGITAATDVYSLGTILYELLVGELPFLKQSPIATLKAVVEHEPVRPTAHVPSIHRNLEAICLKCLNKDPQKRYESAFELGQDLQRWLDGSPVSARRPSSLERIGKWCARNPKLTAAMVLLAAGLSFALLEWRSASIQSERAERHLLTTQDTINELISATSRNENLPPAVRMQFVNRAVAMQNKLLEEEPDDDRIRLYTAFSHVNLGRVLQNFGDHEEAVTAFKYAIELLESIPADENTPALLSSSRSHMAISLRGLGRFDEAIEIVEATAQRPNQSRSELAEALGNSGLAYSLDYKYDEARIKFEQSLLLFENLDKKNMLTENQHAAVLRFYGQLEHQEKNYERAEELLTSALEKFEVANASAPFHESMLLEATRIIGARAEARLELGKLELAKKDIDAASENIAWLFERDSENHFTQSLRIAEIARNARLKILELDWDEAKTKLDNLADFVDALSPEFTWLESCQFNVIDHRLMLASHLAIANRTDEAVEQLNIVGDLLDAFQASFPDFHDLIGFVADYQDLKESLE